MDTKKQIWQGPRYKITLETDGYYATAVNNEGLQKITAKSVGPCVSIAQAHYLANHGKTRIG